MSWEFAVSSRLVLDDAEIDHETNDPTGMTGRELAKRGRRILRAAKEQVGVNTGELRESLYVRHERVGNSQELWIGSDDDIALIHHEGTRPHAIEARGPKVLRYSSGGRVAYAKRVMHPGTEPNHYLTDNLYLAYI